jgi:uncharacterized protein YdhG (YjbR/CyaY superfamily)
MRKATDVDSYIAESVPEAHPVLNELRTLIKATIPEVNEGIWYGIPFYEHHGELVGYDTAKKHVSFGFGKDVIEEDDRKALEAQGYKLGKGTLQIKFDQEVPVAAIEKILRTKAKRNEAVGGMKINLK